MVPKEQESGRIVTFVTFALFAQPGITRNCHLLALSVTFWSFLGPGREVRDRNSGFEEAGCRPERGRAVTDFSGTNGNKIAHGYSCCNDSRLLYRFYSELYSSARIRGFIIPSKRLGSGAGVRAGQRYRPFRSSCTRWSPGRVYQGCTQGGVQDRVVGPG